MSDREPLPVSILLGDRLVPSQTRGGHAGAYVLVLSTAVAVPEAPLELHSTYTGHPGADTVAVHLKLWPVAGGGRAATQTVTHRGAEVPVLWAPDRCLLDHLQVFQDLALEHDLTARIELDEPLARIRERLAGDTATAAASPTS